ncbi:MAG: T9SS type A sorting domain-containing protein, partial [Bacteroidales bacterium]|nr:T9SS type A sorting domain-containing protein [Bacteroidales bacterium]
MKTRIYKLVLGVFIALISFSVSAQDYEYIPLVKPGLQLWTWDLGYLGYDDEAYRFRRYALTEEDTLINNITYKKLYEFTDIEFNPLTAIYYGGFRENSQKQVFFKGERYNDNNEFMIYDFSLSAGDTFNLPYNNEPSYFEIVAIDTLIYSGIPRRKFTIRNIPEFSFAPQYSFWIEGIGNYEGLIQLPRVYAVDNWLITRCYIHNRELLYSNYSHGGNDCITPLMGVESIIEDNSITIYPNPSNSEVNISSENIINSIEIFNSLGQRVYQSVVNSNTKTIDISSFVN